EVCSLARAAGGSVQACLAASGASRGPGARLGSARRPAVPGFRAGEHCVAGVGEGLSAGFGGVAFLALFDVGDDLAWLLVLGWACFWGGEDLVGEFGPAWVLGVDECVFEGSFEDGVVGCLGDCAVDGEVVGVGAGFGEFGFEVVEGGAQ